MSQLCYIVENYNILLVLVFAGISCIKKNKLQR